MTHAMLDLETLGLERDSVIVQIGACIFYPGREEPIGETFKANLDIRQQGRVIDPDTMMWWAKQDPAVYKRVFLDHDPSYDFLVKNGGTPARLTLDAGLAKLSIWAKRNGVFFWWANSPSFDITMINHARAQNLMDPLCSHKDERDFRTIMAMVKRHPDWEKSPAPITHDALEDAVAQARDLCRAFKLLKLPEIIL